MSLLDGETFYPDLHVVIAATVPPTDSLVEDPARDDHHVFLSTSTGERLLCNPRDVHEILPALITLPGIKSFWIRYRTNECHILLQSLISLMLIPASTALATMSLDPLLFGKSL